MSDEYDVVIIGSGAGGGTLAHRLAPSGKRVLILERGDWLPREVENWDAQAVFVDNRYVSPDTWYDGDGQGVPAADPLLRRRRDEVLRRRALPAARARLRGAQAPRRHLARVADRLRRHGAVLHAGRAAVPGARGPRRGLDRPVVQRARTRSRRCRTSRGSSSCSTTCSKVGLHPFHSPSGIMLDEADPAFSACIRCATCDGFPCLVHAKSDADVVAVRPAIEHDNVTLVRNAQVLRLETDPTGRTVTTVVAEVDGAEQRFTGSIVVVSAGAANSARLLLASANDAHPNGLANGSDQVGRNYMFHNSRAFLAVSLEKNDTHFQKTLGRQRLLLRRRGLRLPDGQRADGRQVVGADVPGREADRDRARADVRPRGRGRARGRLLAVRRGPARARQPGDPRPATATIVAAATRRTTASRSSSSTRGSRST